MWNYQSQTITKMAICRNVVGVQAKRGLCVPLKAQSGLFGISRRSPWNCRLLGKAALTQSASTGLQPKPLSGIWIVSYFKSQWPFSLPLSPPVVYTHFYFLFCSDSNNSKWQINHSLQISYLTSNLWTTSDEIDTGCSALHFTSYPTHRLQSYISQRHAYI